MRISPLGIFCCNWDRERTSEFARQDAALTHPHPICLQTNSLFTMAIAEAVGQSKSAQQIYEDIKDWVGALKVEKPLIRAILNAAAVSPADYIHKKGWVLIAFQNALWQLLHAKSLEEGVVNTVMCGGDTDTNAAICGALLGAVYGREALPKQWVDRSEEHTSELQ